MDALESLIGVLSRRKLKQLRPKKYDEDATFDYVVVGGGTAGIVMATRLAEAGHDVALIEAGYHYEVASPFLASTPGADTLFVGADEKNAQPLMDWRFAARDQPGTNRRTVHIAQGRCLGGSSAFNFMIYQRPTVESLQAWADAVDDQSYAFERVLDYYQKSVRFTPPTAAKRSQDQALRYEPKAFSDNGGPLHVSYANYTQPLSTWLGPAFEELGFGRARDFNSGKLMGYQYCASTISPARQKRASSEASYLQSAVRAGLGNLKVYVGTLARRVLIDGDDQVTGVEVSAARIKKATQAKKDSQTWILHARREVVVCSGAFRSPQLLMLSGIGPPDTLAKFAIPVRVASPGVGQGMWDHPCFSLSYPIKAHSLSKMSVHIRHLVREALRYMLLHKGPLTNPVSDWLAWEKIPQSLRAAFTPETVSKLATFPPDWPEVEYISGAGYIGQFRNLMTSQPRDDRNYGSILCVVVAPLSRGYVTLSSASPADLPEIHPNWLSDPADQELAIAAFKRARQAWNSEAVSLLLDGDEAFPGQAVAGDDDILRTIKDSLMTLWHPACTCRMGRDGDDMAVLDSEARVRGVKRLRVVDASAFPILPPGHPQSTVYMLAEKIADSMIEKARGQKEW